MSRLLVTFSVTSFSSLGWEILFLGETGSQRRQDQGGPSPDSDMRNEGQNGAGDIC